MQKLEKILESHRNRKPDFFDRLEAADIPGKIKKLLKGFRLLGKGAMSCLKAFYYKLFVSNCDKISLYGPATLDDIYEYFKLSSEDVLRLEKDYKLKIYSASYIALEFVRNPIENEDENLRTYKGIMDDIPEHSIMGIITRSIRDANCIDKTLFVWVDPKDKTLTIALKRLILIDMEK